MKRIGTSGSSNTEHVPEYIDFVDHPNQAKARIDLRGRKSALIVAAVVTAFATIWFSWIVYVSPALDERLVRDAVAELRGTLTPEQIPGFDLRTGATANNSEQRNLRIAELLLDDDKQLDDSHRKMIEAALRLAVRAGSAEAYLVRGVALRDGSLGAKDAEAALIEFQRAWAATESGVKAGDSAALWVRAKQLHDGIGVSVDLEAAQQTALRAAKELRGWRLREASQAAAWGHKPFNRKEPEVAEQLFGRRMAAGDTSEYFFAAANCKSRFPHEPVFDRITPEIERALADGARCRARWYRMAAEAGSLEAMGDYGQWLIEEEGQLDSGLSWLNAGRAALSSSAKIIEAAVLLARSTESQQTNEGIEALGTAISEERSKAEKNDSVIDDPAWSLSRVWTSFRQPNYLTHQEWHRLGAAIAQVSSKAGQIYVVDTRLRRDAVLSPEWQSAYAGFRGAVIRQGSAVDPKHAVKPEVDWSQFTPVESAVGPKPVRKPGAWKEFDGSLDVVHPGPLGVNDERVDASQPAAPRASKAPDRGQQDRTGYLRGAERLATGGMSRFTVDNSQGGADAVAQLYLGGKKPAVRSFFVKKGEAFTAEGLLAGDYVLRYRFAGSDDTFEADRSFALQERQTEGGTAFSNVKVTLFRVSSGNMQTKQVANDAF